MTTPGPEPGLRQRIDKWLWYARLLKSRTLAAKLVEDGHVRVNSVRIDNPAKTIQIGDVLTVALDREVRVLRMVSAGDRRGPYPEAKLLYQDLTTETPAPATDAPSLSGGGTSAT